MKKRASRRPRTVSDADALRKLRAARKILERLPGDRASTRQQVASLAAANRKVKAARTIVAGTKAQDGARRKRPIRKK
jgi:hypothetical protein